MAKAKNLLFNINEKTGCFEVISHAPGADGYPKFYKNRKYIVASRYMYELYKGPIPEGLIIRHTCDNRICVNPAHLLVGTYQDNSNDAIERGRTLTGEKNHSAKLTIERVREIRTSQESNKSLADRFGVVPQTVFNIRKGKRWKKVA